MRGLTDRIRYPRFESHLERLGGIGDGNSFTMPSQNEIYDYVMKAKCDAENDLVALGKRKTFFSVITEKFIVNCYYIFLVGVTIVRDTWQSFDQTLVTTGEIDRSNVAAFFREDDNSITDMHLSLTEADLPLATVKMSEVTIDSPYAFII